MGAEQAARLQERRRFRSRQRRETLPQETRPERQDRIL